MRRGAIVMLASQWGRAASQIVALVVLARLLDPSDYGLVAMSSALVGLATVVGDFGLSLAAIQAASLSKGQRSNLFWLNAGLGLAGAVAMAAVAPLIAAFYGEPRLTPLTYALAVVFLLNGCAVQFIVELNRAHRFAMIGLAQLTSQLLGVSVAIICAALSAGYWALVAQQVVAGAALLLTTVLTARWLPGLPDRTASVRPLLRFGAGSLTSQLLGYTTSNLDSVLIGRTFSAAVLGLYNRAYTIAMIPIVQVLDPLTRIVVPRLARAATAADFTADLARVQRLTGFLVLAPLGLAAATAPNLLVVALGPQWGGSAVLLRILALAAALQSLNYVYYWAFMAKAKPGLLFLAEVWGKLVIVALLLALISRGPVLVGWGVVVGGAVGLAGAVVVGRRIGVEPGLLLNAWSEPVLVFGGASVVAWLAAVVTHGDPLVSLTASCAAWSVWIVVCALLHPRLRSEVVGLLQRASRRSAAVPS